MSGTFTQLSAQYCATVKGKVTDSLSMPLASVIVSLQLVGKKTFSITDSKGNFSLKICAEAANAFSGPASISFKLLGYLDKTISQKLSTGETQVVDVSLAVYAKQLKEVIVENKAITQRGDTTAFTVAAFKNKLDNNLEDVLRKMPGFDIDESGRINYNNKPIETILIEGDELAKNYKLISKNIPPDALDKVEMIDKYEQNPLYQGISNSRKQAMNLTLKNPKHVSTFGNTRVGGGIPSKYNLAGNLFGINKYFKTMLLGNANNTGANPYDEVVYEQKTAIAREYEFDNTLLRSTIPENTLFTKPLYSTITNNLFNHSAMATFNSSLRINDTWSAKLFSDVYRDRIDQSQSINFNNNLDHTLSYQTATQKTFRPRNQNYYLQLKSLTKKTQLLFTGIYAQKKYEEQDTILSTISSGSYQAGLGSLFDRKGLGFYFTRRIDSSHLLELSAQYLYDSKSQQYAVGQEQYRNIDSVYQADSLLQKATTAIDYFKGDIRYLTKAGTGKPFELRLTNIYYQNHVGTDLTLHTKTNEYLTPALFLNNNRITNNRLQLFAGKDFSTGKFTAALGLGVASINNTYSLQGIMDHKDNYLLPVGNATLRYKANRLNDFQLGIDLNAVDPGSNSLNYHQVLTSFRSFTQHVPFNRNLPYLQTNLTYIYRDLDKGSSLIFSWVYLNRQKNEVSSIRYETDFDYYNNRFVDRYQQQHTLFIKYDKYISRLKTSFNLRQSMNWFSQPLEANNTILSNQNFAYVLNASFRPSISNSLNLNTGINLTYTRDLSSKKSNYQLGPFVNTTLSISNHFSAGAEMQYLRDNYSTTPNNYYFINANVWYTVQPGKIDIKLSLRNLCNTQMIFSGTTNNIYTQYASQRILPRFGLIELQYKF